MNTSGTPASDEPAAAEERLSDILNNNSGVAHNKPFHHLRPKKFHKLTQVKIVTATRLTGTLVPEMLNRASPKLINVASRSPSPSRAGLTTPGAEPSTPAQSP